MFAIFLRVLFLQNAYVIPDVRSDQKHLGGTLVLVRAACSARSAGQIPTHDLCLSGKIDPYFLWSAWPIGHVAG